jgi:hypothetical protein
VVTCDVQTYLQTVQSEELRGIIEIVTLSGHGILLKWMCAKQQIGQ